MDYNIFDVRSVIILPPTSTLQAYRLAVLFQGRIDRRVVSAGFDGEVELQVLGCRLTY